MIYDARVRHRPVSLALAISCAVVCFSATLRADPVWIDRRLTLVKGEWGVDLGVGIAHDGPVSTVGTGAYGQLHYGITDRMEVSVREGVNFGLYGRYARASQYARLYTLDGAVSQGPGPLGNPDLVFLGRFVDLGWLELAAELETGFPEEANTHVDNTLGIAAAIHVRQVFLLDTGGFVTLTYRSPLETEFTIPLQMWFEPLRAPLWFGVLGELKTIGGSGTWEIPVGAGIGYALTQDIDVRAEAFVPQINLTPGTRVAGGGIGTQIRF
jgi:hypothetical protein